MNKELLLKKIRESQEPEERVPHYQEMGYDPPVGGKSILHNSSGIPLVKTPPLQIPQPATQEKSIKIPASRRNVPMPPPQSQFVHSGANEEQLWTDGRVFNKETGIVDNNDTVDVRSVQGKHFADLEQQLIPEDEFKQQPIPEVFQQAHSQPINQQSDKDSSLEKLKRGEFVLVVYGEIMGKSYDPSVIRESIEELILKHDVSLDDITVLKSLNIGFGVSFTDGI